MTHDSHVARTSGVKNLFDSGLAGDTKRRIMELRATECVMALQCLCLQRYSLAHTHEGQKWVV